MSPEMEKWKWQIAIVKNYDSTLALETIEFPSGLIRSLS